MNEMEDMSTVDDIKKAANIQYWLWLTQIPYVGPVISGRLLEKFITAEAVYYASEEQLKQISGITKRQIASILQTRSLDTANCILENCRQKQISILTKDDARYPLKAKRVKDAPPVLYYQGILPAELPVDPINDNRLQKTVGIVGARRCTYEAKRCCVDITKQCIENHELVISGMAKGIDASAGTVCINSNAYTIAIVGNGLDICYPAEHLRLMERIRERGLLLSEYPPGTEPSEYTFPRRNRLIAAWSDRLIVIAAGRGSGAMITANYAKQYGRQVDFFL